MTISLTKNLNFFITKSLEMLKNHSVDLGQLITKDILPKSNIDQFLFLIGIVSHKVKISIQIFLP